MPKIIRSAVIGITFNQPVTAIDATGVTATVHGAEQAVVLSGSGTNVLKYTLQRAIFRHEVTWAYDGLGNIKSVDGNQPLGAINEFVVTNLLPAYTVWDYDGLAPDANTDTTWDGDETRFDEEA